MMRNIASFILQNRGLHKASELSLLRSPRAAAFATKAKKEEPKDDDDTFELLPPGCSMVDPTYGIKDSETTVLFYDEAEAAKQAEIQLARRKIMRSGAAMPISRAAAQKQLDDKKNENEDDESYVYLPPGSSMRDPGYNSMSDPTERRVYYRDPTPSTKKT